jgi:hypothetical protein
VLISGCFNLRYSGGTSTLLPQYSQRTEGASSGTGKEAPQVGQWKDWGEDGDDGLGMVKSSEKDNQ